MYPRVYIWLYVYGWLSASEQVFVQACICDPSALPAPLPGPGVSSSMSFEEEEEDEDENSSSSSQLNSNTRPSSATSRKSVRVRRSPAQQGCGRQSSEGDHLGCRGMGVKK